MYTYIQRPLFLYIPNRDQNPYPLVSPVSLHQVRPISRHRSKESLCPEISQGPSYRHSVLTLQSKLHMRNTQQEQSSHGIIEYFAVGAVQLCDRGEEESERHVFNKIDLRAAFDFERIRFTGGRINSVANVLFVLDTLVDNTVGKEEVVGGEWEGPGADNS